MLLNTDEFKTIVYRENGFKLRVQIFGYPEASFKLRYPLRRLFVKTQGSLPVGSIVTTIQGEKYLIADDLVDYSPHIDRRSLLMIRVDQTGDWMRHVEEIDAVTELTRDGALQTLETGVHFQTREITPVEDGLRIKDARLELITNREILVDDLVGDHHVIDVEKRLGIYFAKVR